MICRHYERDGWEVDQAKSKCPKCAKSIHRPHAEGEIVQANNSHPGNIAQLVKSPTSSAGTKKPVAEPPRQLNPEERTRVRALLDGHFDDAVGRYIDGYSDQRIGAELDIPWLRVQEIRELAYGPIKEDPVVVELREELSIIRKRLDAADAKLAAIQ